ncbi:MAG TPA: FecR domain-containing protein [Chitinophaga sp.]|uniref:FecR family protein n=1 Tax=Chitinophaga sp. TaxID=1869181 RepID=UPI002C9EA18E|nr:FecR domain-containing protein [Chitinophaga sp.]HVI44326.1 FecR domain-containing protein [Chitinophaga sp.]
MLFISDTFRNYQGWIYVSLLLIAGAIIAPACTQRKQASNTVQLQVPGVKYTSHEGETGLRKSITLPDGTIIILNSATLLQVPENYNKGSRTVILDGDALFHVKAGADSFIVVNDKLIATTLDTGIFRMRSFSSQQGATTYQLTGKIRIGKSYHSPTDNQPEILERGQMLLANKEIDLIEKETYHPEELETWISDTLTIKNANPMAISRILEDWYGIEVEMRGDASKARTISEAAFFNASLNDVLSNLSGQQDFKYKISRNKAVITF